MLNALTANGRMPADEAMAYRLDLEEQRQRIENRLVELQRVCIHDDHDKQRERICSFLPPSSRFHTEEIYYWVECKGCRAQWAMKQQDYDAWIKSDYDPTKVFVVAGTSRKK